MTIFDDALIDSCGAIYVAIGSTYVIEALVSAQSLKKAIPSIPITLFTDADNVDCSYIDKVVQVASAKVGRFGDKILAMADSPYERTIFLDTDTFVVSDFSEVFTLLDRFDIALSYAQDWGQVFDDLPSCFPELNSGVVAYRRNVIESGFFDKWLGEYRNNLQYTDQVTMGRVLYQSDLRFAILNERYNLRYFKSGVLVGNAKIIHVRPPRGVSLDELASAIGSRGGTKVFISWQMLVRMGSGFVVYTDLRKPTRLFAKLRRRYFDIVIRLRKRDIGSWMLYSWNLVRALFPRK